MWGNRQDTQKSYQGPLHKNAWHQKLFQYHLFEVRDPREDSMYYHTSQALLSVLGIIAKQTGQKQSKLYSDGSANSIRQNIIREEYGQVALCFQRTESFLN